jgi:hypothetical protein
MERRIGIFWLLSTRRACLGVRKEAQRSVDHLTSVLVTSRSNLGPDEGIQFSGQGYVTDLIFGDLFCHASTVPC